MSNVAKARGSRGFTLVELIVTVVIIGILVGMALPLARNSLKREREIELRQALREMRLAIDKYKDFATAGLIPPGKIDSDKYPETLQQLVEGVKLNGQVDKKIRFLRRIPIDPMTGNTEWGKRSLQDDPDSDSSNGDNVFDVYTKSAGTGLDGTEYKSW